MLNISDAREPGFGRKSVRIRRRLRAMFERPGYWRWLGGNLARGRELLYLATHPVAQVGYSLSCISLTLTYTYVWGWPYLFLLVPSFLLMTHGFYRVS